MAKYVCGPRPVEGAWETANQSPIPAVFITSVFVTFSIPALERGLY